MKGMAEPVVLRPRTVSDILDAAVGLYRHNFGTLLGVVAVVYAPLLAINAIAMALIIAGVSHLMAQREPGLGFFGGALGMLLAIGLLSVGSIVFAPLSSGAVTLAVSDLHLGRKVTVRDAYRRAARHWGWLILLQFIIQAIAGTVGQVGALVMMPGMMIMALSPIAGGFVMGLGYLFAICLTVAAYVFAVPAIPSMVVEKKSLGEALSHCWALVRPWWKHASGAYILLSLMAVMPLLMAGGVIGLVALQGGRQGLPLTAAIAGALAIMAQLLVMPITLAGRVVIYYDLRVRQEGLDLEMMAANLDLKKATASGLPAPALSRPAPRPAPPPPPPPPPKEQRPS